MNFDQLEYRTNIIFTGITDHFPVTFRFERPRHCNNNEDKVRIMYRQRGEIFDDQFRISLQNSNLNDVLLMQLRTELQ